MLLLENLHCGASTIVRPYRFLRMHRQSRSSGRLLPQHATVAKSLFDFDCIFANISHTRANPTHYVYSKLRQTAHVSSYSGLLVSITTLGKAALVSEGEKHALLAYCCAVCMSNSIWIGLFDVNQRVKYVKICYINVSLRSTIGEFVKKVK